MKAIRILGTICARGGSKGVKNKNIRLLLGKPLISYSIEVLKAWHRANRIICSTDSLEIQKIAREYGAETPFLRPAELATDTAGKLNVLKHLLDFCENEEKKTYDYIIDLDATSPLRTVKDIDLAFNKLYNSKADMITSAYKAERNPYFNMVEYGNDNYIHLCKKSKQVILARQQAPLVYALNASIYIYRRDYLKNTSSVMAGKIILYEMSDYSIDIDRELDFEFIEFLLKESKYKFDF